MPLERMPRLRAVLAPATGAAATGVGGRRIAWADAVFIARFRYDEQGLATIEVTVRAELPLVCQRSLQPYLEKVERSSLLTVIEDIADQDEIPESYDPVLVEQGRMALLDLVEDELLLAVPQVPRSPDTKAVELSTEDGFAPPSGIEDEQSHRPFEGLAGLLRETKEN